MPLLRVYDVFISHAWHRDEEYWRVVSWLDAAPNFEWRNLSVPEHDPVDDEELAKQLRDQMRPASVFVICAGMWVAHSEWIKFEIEFARRIGRPIIAVAPWSSERLPALLQQSAREVVGRSDSLVRAIREHALPLGE
jgi:hypothetical protein